MTGSARSVVFTSPGEVELKSEEQELHKPAATEVSGRTIVSLVSSGTELAMFTGANPPPYPFRPGYAARRQYRCGAAARRRGAGRGA